MSKNVEISRLHDELFNGPESVSQRFMSLLWRQSDEELLETRRRAKELGDIAWRIVCAADKELASRAENRGKKKEIIDAAAKELGVSPQTIYVNARVHDVINSYEQSKSVLTLPTTINVDKSLVIASLNAHDPVKALDTLIQNKEKDNTYSTRDAKRDVAAMKVKRSDVALPEGKFSVILADPPWRYDFGNSDNRIIENHYPTMEIEDICALPIPDLCADDCTLFLWTTSPKLEQSFEVLHAWGFKYSTCAVWDKEVIGMGYYFRQQHELLLVAKRGSLPVPEPSARPSSVIRAARREHSQKPEEVYCLLEAMYPKAKKIELFCRHPREGWIAWGNEL